MAQVSEKAGQATAGAQEKAQQAKGQAQDKAQQVAGQAQEKAQEAKGQAGGKLREQVDQRSTQAGEQVSTTAQDVRSVGEQLREQGKEQPAKLADQAADRAEQLGSYLKDSDADRILGDIEDFGRRQPLAVAAAGLALGFAASRFLKASSSQRYQSAQGSGSYSGGGVSPRPAYPGAASAYPPAGSADPAGTSTVARPVGEAGGYDPR